MNRTRKYWVEVSWLERQNQRLAQHAENEFDAAAKVALTWGTEEGFRVERVSYEGD